jgi:hypothetical protein
MELVLVLLYVVVVRDVRSRIVWVVLVLSRSLRVVWWGVVRQLAQRLRVAMDLLKP